nr:coadhesin-like [Hydra vulgaris]
MDIVVTERLSYLLKCPDESVIKIQNAIYGDFGKLNRCNLTVTNVVQNMCNGNSSCLISSNNDVFGVDPCLTVTKSTIVDYYCYLEKSTFVDEIENKYTNKTLNVFYDEYWVSFTLLSPGNQQINILQMNDKNNNSVLTLDIYNDFLKIITFNGTYFMKMVANTWNSIVISQSFIHNNNTYVITGVVNETNQFSNISTSPMVFTDVILHIFSDCILKSVCSYGSIKSLSIYSKTQVIWSQWSEWSDCEASCVMTRTRNCSNNQLLNCIGRNTEVDTCKYKYQAQESIVLKNETLIQSGFLVGTLKNMNKEYMVSLEVKPTSFDNTTYRNILQLTANRSLSNYGDRNPLIYFTNKTGCLVVSSAINGIKNKILTIKTLSLNEWASIKVVQQLVNGSYNFSVAINGNVITSVINLQPIEFSNAKVYASDPWNPAQSGFIRNLIVRSGTFASWTQWSNWTRCNASHEFTNRTRECNSSTAIDECEENKLEEKEYFVFWSQWSKWTSCNVTHGFIIRTRECNSSSSMYGCYGNGSEVKECFVLWEKWNSWTGCNELNKFMNRSRKCRVLNSEEICFGNNSEVMECPAYWSKWSDWTVCNASYGFINRTRECKISNARNWCYFNNSDVIKCFAIWAQWSDLISCNFSHKFLNKSRDCKISNVIDWCQGNNTEIMEWFEKWTIWGECSVTCGLGYRSKYSQHETIKVIKVESCNQISCPENGMWGQWSNSECSNTCGNGIKFLSRRCDNPPPSYNGRDCIGASNYTEVCNNDKICPLNGNWSLWSSWSLCSQPCGGGLQSRFRSCSNPVPNFGGQKCNGSFEEFVNCTSHNCKSVNLKLNMNFLGEKYNDWHSTSTGFLSLKNKLHDAIAKLYTNHKVNFEVVIHSIDSDP